MVLDEPSSLPVSSPYKSSIPSRIKFVRHHSAPLHHRSPVKMRERLMEQQDLEDIRTRIRAFRNDLYKYKSTYTRSPIKRLNSTGGEVHLSPFKHPSPQTPVKRYKNRIIFLKNNQTSLLVIHLLQHTNVLVQLSHQ
jgi:hypothetical protein